VPLRGNGANSSVRSGTLGFIKAIRLAFNPREPAEIMFDKHYRNAAVFFGGGVKIAGGGDVQCVRLCARVGEMRIGRHVTRILLNKQTLDPRRLLVIGQRLKRASFAREERKFKAENVSRQHERALGD
jgi:hypothetical protein